MTLPTMPKGDRGVIPKFFDYKPVVYNVGREDITAILTLQARDRLVHSSGSDYYISADLEVNRKPTLSPPKGRYSEVRWAVELVHISNDYPLKFGGLFERLQEPAEAIASMLSPTGNKDGRANVHLIRRCIYDLQDRVVRDFDWPEFSAQFRKKSSD